MFATICLFLLQCYLIACEYQKLHTAVICIFRQCFVCIDYISCCILASRPYECFSLLFHAGWNDIW